jgi:hypothetical protein
VICAGGGGRVGAFRSNQGGTAVFPSLSFCSRAFLLLALLSAPRAAGAALPIRQAISLRQQDASHFICISFFALRVKNEIQKSGKYRISSTRLFHQQEGDPQWMRKHY